MLVTKPVRALSQILVMGLAAWLVLQHDRSPAIIFASSLLFGRALSPVEGALTGWKSLRAWRWLHTDEFQKFWSTTGKASLRPLRLSFSRGRSSSTMSASPCPGHRSRCR